MVETKQGCWISPRHCYIPAGPRKRPNRTLFSLGEWSFLKSVRSRHSLFQYFPDAVMIGTAWELIDNLKYSLRFGGCGVHGAIRSNMCIIFLVSLFSQSD